MPIADHIVQQKTVKEICISDLVTTSGAIQYGVPTIVDRLFCSADNWAQNPKSAVHIQYLHHRHVRVSTVACSKHRYSVGYLAAQNLPENRFSKLHNLGGYSAESACKCVYVINKLLTYFKELHLTAMAWHRPYMGSHGITCHPTQVNTSRLQHVNPSRTSVS